jgi:hypothetical protein
VRLQEEIIKKRNDHSILAWSPSNISPHLDDHHPTSVLAKSPGDFQIHSSHLKHGIGNWYFRSFRKSFRSAVSRPSQITTKGLKIWLPFLFDEDMTKRFSAARRTRNIWKAVLLMENGYSWDCGLLVIYLVECGDGIYARIMSHIVQDFSYEVIKRSLWERFPLEDTTPSLWQRFSRKKNCCKEILLEIDDNKLQLKRAMVGIALKMLEGLEEESACRRSRKDTFKHII